MVSYDVDCFSLSLTWNKNETKSCGQQLVPEHEVAISKLSVLVLGCELRFTRIAWEIDNADQNFPINRHPESRNLVISMGGRRMSFLINLVVGKLIAAMFEDD
jgi:hypothetical protein